MKNLLTLIIRLYGIALCLVIMIMANSCANMIPPSGGPRDSLPPRLVIANPKDSATNVKTKNILLTFDEFVSLQNTENIIYAPVPKNLPQVDYKLRNVTVRFKDSLEENTTYSIDFGNSIIDVNESNVAKNFRYVFSTGPTIDFHTYEGKVLVAETGKVDSTLIVVLHKNTSDSAIKKLSPRFFTRIDGKGAFKFNNLPSGTFAAYIVNGKSYNKTFDSSSLFAFRDSLVQIGSNSNKIDTFYAFTQSITTDKKATDPSSGLPPSLRDDKRLRYIAILDNGMQDLLSDFKMVFNRKVFSLDTGKVRLTDNDDVLQKGYTVALDSLRKTFTLRYPWKENTTYKLVIQKDAALDSNATSLPKTDTLLLSIRKETEYGSVRFRFLNVDTSQHAVLQLFQNDEQVASYPINQNDIQIRRFKPGSYELRILYDRNKNGKWDTGSFTPIKKQPEKVFYIPRQLNIRANWDNETTIALQ
ncbi:MAG: Ig-like domain-containing protein [Sediminibacterium sp.]|uniref:Ig-like domain-containing protein n=1 Tax=Sediminibacterium sp. TaxID=1917865 RepID=UPI003F7270AC